MSIVDGLFGDESSDSRTRTDGGATVTRESGDDVLRIGGLATPFRGLALLSGAVLLGSFVSVLYGVTDVVGMTGWLIAVVAGALALATLVANVLGARSAFLVAVGLLIAGLGAYLSLVPSVYLAVVSTGAILGDTLALLTGLSVLRMTAAGSWALGVAPGPAFLTWYFTLRHRYVRAAVVGGATLGFFVLTGDASPLVTLVGMVAAAALVGFGTLDRLGGTIKQVDALAILTVVMVIAASWVSVVPGGGSNPLAPGSGPTPTVEGSLLSADDRLSVTGSIRLSPEVRFSVESDRESYWRAAAYDRYTGNGWVRSGGSRALDGSLPPPERSAYRVTQTFTAEDAVGTMPAAWKPVRVTSGSEGVRVSELGGLQPESTFSKGDSYTVVSRVPNADPNTLQRAGTNYPEEIRERYLQLPDSTSDRLADRTAEITEDENTPYRKAVAIEKWLEANKEYSLSVERPTGNIAESFVFEMDAGYCTYYATSMVAMLRSQGVPARFVVGYSPGQRVGENEWVVRGMNSHAWVEVYFPEVGWVRFDPTPSAPREEARQTQLAQARAANETGVDTAGSGAGSWTPIPEEPNEVEGGSTDNSTVAGLSEDQLIERLQPGGPGVVNRTEVAQTANGTIDTPTPDDDEASPFGLPSRRMLAYALLALVGALAAGHYTGGLERAYRAIWLRFQRARRDPKTDTERAFRRLEYLLGREFRERRPEETPREYLDALTNVGLDDRAYRVGRLYERAAYAGSVSRTEAEEAIAIVDEVVSERIGLLGD